MSLVCITGGAGSLGRAFAVECASRGWNVFLTDLNAKDLETFARGLAKIYGINVFYHACDLTDPESRNGLFDHIRDAGYRFWCLINVAGLDHEGGFLDKSRDEIRTIIRLNIEANLEMTHEILKYRDEAEKFRLINVASMAAYYPIPIKATYAASKHFLLSFSYALREEIRELGGTVTTLCPGGMPTNPLVKKSIEAQGFMGRITTSNVGSVAAETVSRALKGRAVYIPRAANRILWFLGRIIPQKIIARVLVSRWKLAHARSRGLLSA
jgi:short-subunit dehydrogenase